MKLRVLPAKLISAVIVVWLLTPEILAANESDRPNIIFILTDDQRYDSLGCTGDATVETPHLDQLAKQGVLFDRAYVTSAICMPSRASYLLGQYERKHGVNFNSGMAMSEEAWSQSYPVLLRNAGYYTGYVGKNHVPIGKKGYRTGVMERSFDYWYAGHHHLSFYPKEFHEIFDSAAKDTQAEIIAEGSLGFIDPESNESFLNRANNFLKRRPVDQPFCLSICLNLPHGFSTSRMQQRSTDDELYKTKYREHIDSLPLAPHYLARSKIDSPKLPRDVLLTQLRQSGYDWVDQPNTARERMIRIMQAITGIDRLVGKLRKCLQDQRLEENTVIIFASDHGLFFGEFGLGGKALCYETTLHIPMIIFDPRVESTKRSKELVLSIDIAPTILDLAHVDLPSTVQGTSLMPLVKGESTQWRTAVFAENLWSNIFGNPRCETVRTKTHRYIRYFKNENLEIRKRTPANKMYIVTDEIAENYKKSLTSSIDGERPVYEELFHTDADPHESMNLAEQDQHQGLLAEMRELCQKLVIDAKGNPALPPSTDRVDHDSTKTWYRNNR